MKRFIALLLVMVITLGTFGGCSEGHFRFDEEDSITRGEWIEKLSTVFGLDTYEQQDAYFSDMSSSDSSFAPVQACYEWDILRDVSKEFKKDDSANFKFAITTAVYATGADLSEYSGDSDSEKALDFASAMNISPAGVDHNDYVTYEQADHILEAAKQAYLDIEFEPVDTVVMQDNVSDQRDTNTITAVNDNEYAVSNITPKAGDILIAPATKENPEGVAIKVESVTDNGNGTYNIKTVQPEIHEVIDEVEYSGVAVPEFEDIIPADGVTISQGSASPTLGASADSLAVSNLTNITDNSSDGTLPIGKTAMGNSKDNALSFTVNLDLTKGTIAVAPGWGDKSYEIKQLLTGENAGTASPDLGQWFEKTSVFPDKTLFGPDKYSNDEAIDAYKMGVITADELRQALEGMHDKDGKEKIPNMTNKFSGGYSITGTIAINDLYVATDYKLKTKKIFGIDTGIPTGLEKFTVETNYAVEAALSVKGTIENELTVCSIPVPLGAVTTLTIDIKLYVEANGEIAVKASINNNAKTEYTSGKTKKTCTQTSNASVEANIEIEAGPKLSAKLSALSVPIINADVSAAVLLKSSGAINLNTEYTETDEEFIVNRKTSLNYNLDLYVPIVKLSIGSDESTLANKLSITFKWTIISEDKAAHFKLLEEEKILFEDNQVLPKNPENEEESTDEQSPVDDPSGENSSTATQSGGYLKISTYYVELEQGASTTLSITLPEGYTAGDLVWTTSDAAVATVNGGNVSAVGAGNTTITVKTSDGKYNAYCSIYVGGQTNE